MNAPVFTHGRLFYVIGASGAGKDSLIRYAAGHVGEHPVVFAPRYITRAYDPGSENHVPISGTAFERLLRGGCFAMHWQAHGRCYGIGHEIRCWLDNGADVVVNGSRAYLDTASRAFPELRPVLIHVSVATLAQRLRQRARESEAGIQARLARAGAFESLHHPRLEIIDNNGTLARAGEAFVALLTSPSPA